MNTIFTFLPAASYSWHHVLLTQTQITVVAAHENQVSRANIFRNALMKLSGSNDIHVALISNTRKLSDNTMSNSAQIVGDVDGRQCIIVSL